MAWQFFVVGYMEFLGAMSALLMVCVLAFTAWAGWTLGSKAAIVYRIKVRRLLFAWRSGRLTFNTPWHVLLGARAVVWWEGRE